MLIIELYKAPAGLATLFSKATAFILQKFSYGGNNSAMGYQAVLVEEEGAVMNEPNVAQNDIQQHTQEFPKAGVKFSWIVDEFIPVICGGRNAIKNMTTDEVLQTFTKALTANDKCSYCHKLQKENHWAYRAKPNAFVSHAFTYKFLDAVDALEAHFKDERDEAVVWWDLFSINQHIDKDWSIDWLKTTFKSAIQDIGRVVMVMSPWNRPVTFERAWCVFEVYCAIDTGADFQIALSEKDQAQFVHDLKLQGTSVIDEMLAEIRAEKSECSKLSDQDNIHKAIKENGMTLGELNSLLFERYRDWVIQTLKDTLCQTRERQGEDDPETLAVMNNLAVTYQQQGHYGKAEPLFADCLDKRTALLGEDDPDTLRTVNNLAINYQHQGKCGEAETLFQACLERRKVILGDDHHDTLTSMNNLALTFQQQGAYGKAEELLVKCLEKRTAVLGEDHPDTLSSMNNLAVTYNRQGKYSMAEPLLEACLQKRKAVLGEDHPDTLAVMSNLVVLYEQQEEYSKAVPLLEDCVAKRKVFLGEDHPDILWGMWSLARLHLLQQEIGKAKPLIVFCRKKLMPTLVMLVIWAFAPEILSQTLSKVILGER